MSTSENLSSTTKPASEVAPDEYEQLVQMTEDFNQRQSEEAPAFAIDFYKNAREIQVDFDRRMQKIQSAGEEMSEKEFEKWEDALSGEIAFADNELKKTNYSLETVADCAQYMVFSADKNELSKTIEAQSGKYYHARMSSLRKAILAADTSDAQADLDFAKDFYPAVLSHLDFKYMSPEEVRDYGAERYEKSRTMAHNDAIKHLNGLNDLARKYHVRPFTIRNFWPSDARAEGRQTPAIQKVFRYDRHLTEEYYAFAFFSDVQKRRAAEERKNRLGIR